MSDRQYDDIHDLLVRAPAPGLTYDLAATLTTGRRVRRRRRLAAVGGGLIAAAAVALTLGISGVLPIDEALPSGRTDSQTAGRSSVELLDYRYAVEVQPRDKGGLTVTSYSVHVGKRTQLASWTAPANGVSLAPTDVANGVRFAVAPASARFFIPVGEAGLLRRMNGIGVPLPGTAYQAVAFSPTQGGPAEKLSDVIWTDDNGAYDSNGQVLPSFIDPTSEEVLVVDPQRRLFLRQKSGGGFSSDYPEGSTPWVGDNYDTRSNRIQVLSGTFAIPTRGAAAKDISVMWSNGTSSPATVLGGQTAEWTFLHSERTKPEKVPSGDVHPTAVNWTDTAGTRHSEPVKQRVG